ncbi:hypothetical protein HN51_001769 [Arachis hypogaea]
MLLMLLMFFFFCLANALFNLVSLLFCSSMSSESESQLMEDIKDASSVLHLACLVSDAGMVELLLQFRGKIATAKLLILRFQC